MFFLFYPVHFIGIAKTFFIKTVAKNVGGLLIIRVVLYLDQYGNSEQTQPLHTHFCPYCPQPAHHPRRACCPWSADSSLPAGHPQSTCLCIYSPWLACQPWLTPCSKYTHCTWPAYRLWPSHCSWPVGPLHPDSSPLACLLPPSPHSSHPACKLPPACIATLYGLISAIWYTHSCAPMASCPHSASFPSAWVLV